MKTDLNLPPVFQLWQPATQPGLRAGGDIAFEVDASVEQSVLWSLDLPADPEQAAATLAQAEVQLQATQTLLDEAPARLEAFMTRVQSGAGVQFALESTGEASLGAAEASLLPWIDALDPGQVSFGGEGLSRGDVSDAITQLRQAVEDLLGQVLHLARVETRQQGTLLASSLVDWTGDLGTAWGEAVSAEEQSLHRRSLALALKARIALLRIIMTTTQGAAKIAALIAAPGGALLALPAAWKYVQQLLAAISEVQSSPSL